MRIVQRLLRHQYRVFILVLMIIAGGVFRWHQASNLEHKLIQKIPCADVVTGCKAAFLEVKFDHQPKVLKPFVVTVSAEGATEVMADFAMSGMEMGLNRYRFKPLGNGVWQAEVILPVCVQGKSTWLMQLSLMKSGAQLQYQIEFSTTPH